MSGGTRFAKQAGTRSVRGVTLVELLVAMVLGLIVSGAALAVFITNRQTYIAGQNLDRLQEGSRIAFELMSRDLREAAMMPCGDETEVTLNNVVNSAEWWNGWTNAATDSGFLGIAETSGAIPFGAGDGDRAANTDALLFKKGVTAWGDALELKSAGASAVDPAVVTVAKDGADDLEVSSTAGFQTGDILLACDYGHGPIGTTPAPPDSAKRAPVAVIFQASALGANSIGHAKAGSIGNCDDSLFPDGTSACAASRRVLADSTQIQGNGLVSAVQATRWYIGHNGHGSLSLFRSSLRNIDGTPQAVTEEIVRGADGLNLTYYERNGITYNATPADWSKVVAVRVQMHLTGEDRIDAGHVTRETDNVVALRNRAE